MKLSGAILILFTLFSLSTKAQINKDFTIYTSDVLLFEEIDFNGQIVSSKPIGKKISVLKDDYFLSYRLVFSDENMELTQIHLKYLGKEGNKIKVKDDTEAIYFVEDKLKLNGTFKVNMMKDSEYFMGFVVRKAVLQKKESKLP